MDSAANTRPFPFLKLPGEIRNKIYRLVVVTGRILLIRDMHFREFEESQDDGVCRFRSNYPATDHMVCTRNWFSHSCKPWMSGVKTFGPKKTTYTLGSRRVIDHTTTTMLSLNQESRAEVASIFYGENTFYFTTMSSLIPFMKDRTPETRKYLQRLWLTLTIDDRCSDTVFTEYGRPAVWNTAFSALVKLPHLNIKKLYVIIDDRSSNILVHGLNLRSRSMLWLHKLSRLENLEMLGLKYLWAHSRRQRLTSRGPPITADQEASTIETEQDLWKFLAPKMLKKQTGDPSPDDAFQQRRGRDFCRSPIRWSFTGQHPEPDGDSDDEW